MAEEILDGPSQKEKITAAVDSRELELQRVDEQRAALQEQHRPMSEIFIGLKVLVQEYHGRVMKLPADASQDNIDAIVDEFREHVQALGLKPELYQQAVTDQSPDELSYDWILDDITAKIDLETKDRDRLVHWQEKLDAIPDNDDRLSAQALRQLERNIPRRLFENDQFKDLLEITRQINAGATSLDEYEQRIHDDMKRSKALSEEYARLRHNRETNNQDYIDFYERVYPALIAENEAANRQDQATLDEYEAGRQMAEV